MGACFIYNRIAQNLRQEQTLKTISKENRKSAY